MVEIELQISDDHNADSVIGVVERVCSDNGLVCSLKGKLLKYPGSLHWHFKKGKQKGTLEITWWERKRQLWFKVAENRTSAWIEREIWLLKDQIEQALIKF